nr:MAG TPA: hypothetical protein [Caudoviricetes sp.]
MLKYTLIIGNRKVFPIYIKPVNKYNIHNKASSTTIYTTTNCHIDIYQIN